MLAIAHFRRAVVPATALVAAAMLTSAAPASAYDTGPHSEITEDALRAEGFNADAVGVAQVNNWFVDLYEQAEKNPFSGHAGFWRRALTLAINIEDWPDSVLDAANRSHFDGPTLFGTAGVSAEWD